MASGGPVEELCEEASCSICLDFFRDPVTLPECGHSFCRACLGRAWGEASDREASCPQCRARAEPERLRPNPQLANFVEIAKRLARQAAEGARGPLRSPCEEEEEEEEEAEAPLALVCARSAEHDEAVGAATKGRICQKHQEPMKLFCKDDKALLCVVCDRSKEHRNHETLPLEEASQEYKDYFCNCLEILKEERENMLAYKGDVEKESQDLLKQTAGEKQETAAKFRQLHTFLEEQEKLLLAQLEEVEKEVAAKRDRHLAILSDELFYLEILIQETEEKSQQSASDVLQDVRSTLQWYEKQKTFAKPVAFPLSLKWRIWNIWDINHLLEAVGKQLKDTLVSGLPLQKAKVILDPETAHPNITLSEDQKSMREGEEDQARPTNAKRFDNYTAVLGCDGFKSGRHFWEVLVENKEGWVIGVARESIKRKEKFKVDPGGGVWALWKCDGSYFAWVKDHNYSLALSGELKSIRIYLNNAADRVAFFDADTAALLYEFSETSFSGETLLPFFWLYKNGYLKISS